MVIAYLALPAGTDGVREKGRFCETQAASQNSAEND
jgi:hypothetical protein